MRASRYLSLVLLFVAAVVASGFRGAPTAPVRSTTSSAFATPPPLSVVLSCLPDEFFRRLHHCRAEAYDGSGTGYTFIWDNGWETGSGPGWSEVDIECEFYHYSNYTVSVRVRVSDSNGSVVYRYGWVECPAS